MANLERPLVDLGVVNLNQVSDRIFDVDLRGARAASVTAVKLSGAWANKTFEVKKRVGIRLESWGTPKTIAAGGGTVYMTDDELVGVNAIAVVLSGAVDVGYALLTAALEAEQSTAQQWPIVNTKFAPGAEVMQGMPPEV